MLSRKTFVALALSAVALGSLACGGNQSPTSGVYSADFLNGVSQTPPSSGPVPGSAMVAQPEQPPVVEAPPTVEEPVDAGVVVMDSGMPTDVPSADGGRRPRPRPRGRDAGR